MSIGDELQERTDRLLPFAVARIRVRYDYVLNAVQRDLLATSIYALIPQRPYECASVATEDQWIINQSIDFYARESKRPTFDPDGLGTLIRGDNA